MCSERRPIPKFAFNLLEPSQYIPNDPVFLKFQLQSFQFDPNFIGEAFGVLTDYNYDCLGDKQMIGEADIRRMVPSRNMACLQHEARMRMEVSRRPGCVKRIPLPQASGCRLQAAGRTPLAMGQRPWAVGQRL